MSCAGIVIDDGTNQADLTDVWELELNIASLNGGMAIHRFLDGGSAMQFRWRKERFTVTGKDRVPRDLRILDYSKMLTMTVTTGLGVDVYQCYSLGPSEGWNMTGGDVTWSIILEQA